MRTRQESARDGIATTAIQLVEAGPDSDEFTTIWWKLASQVEALRKMRPVNPSLGQMGNFGIGAGEASFRAGLTMVRRGSLRWRILRLIARDAFGAVGGGYADSELEAILRGKHQTISSARRDLVRYGWVEAMPDPLENSEGRFVTSWTLSAAGRKEWERTYGSAANEE